MDGQEVNSTLQSGNCFGDEVFVDDDHIYLSTQRSPAFVMMIMDAKTIILTLIIVTIAFYGGLRIVRKFALSMAQENHDANRAADLAEQNRRAKQEKMADAAAASAFAKVEPILTVPKEERAAEETLPAAEINTV